MSSVRRLGMGLAMFVGLALYATTAQASVEIYDSTNTLVTGATSVTMAQLQSGYSIQVDDKLFSGWTGYNSTISGDNASTGLGTAIAASAITVTGLDANPNNPGLNYQSGLFQITAGQTQDTTFQYTVSTVSGANLIEDSSQTLVSGNVGSATSSIVITEQVTNGATPPVLLAPLTVDEVQLPGSFSSMIFDQKFYTPVSSAQVSKDISLSMNDSATGVTSFSSLDQNFSEVPEPSSMAIAGLGALGMIGYGLRRRKTLGV